MQYQTLLCTLFYGGICRFYPNVGYLFDLLCCRSICYLFLHCLREDLLYLALIYVGAVVVFGGLYMLILNETKVKHLHALREVKRLRKNIKNNEKRIALIRRGIKNDNDDSRYHLEEFDAEIDRLENLHEDVQERQKKALEEFEGNIKQGIQQEILQSAQETKDKLAHDYQVVKGDLVNLDHEQKGIEK